MCVGWWPLRGSCTAWLAVERCRPRLRACHAALPLQARHQPDTPRHMLLPAPLPVPNPTPIPAGLAWSASRPPSAPTIFSTNCARGPAPSSGRSWGEGPQRRPRAAGRRWRSLPCLLPPPAPASSRLPSLTPTPTPALANPCSLEGGAASFRYLHQSDVYTLTDVDDAQEFRCVWVGGSVGQGAGGMACEVPGS